MAGNPNTTATGTIVSISTASTTTSGTFSTVLLYTAPSKPRVAKRKVRPVLVVARCARPKKRCTGTMESTGHGYTASIAPTAWRHRCDKCGYEAHYAETFPRIEYEEVPRGR